MIIGELSILLIALVVLILRYLSCRTNASSTPTVRNEGKPIAIILTASVGGGHEAIGQAVRAELERNGYTVHVEDGLRLMGDLINWIMVGSYARMLRHMRWSRKSLGSLMWDVTFKLTAFGWSARLIRLLVGVFFSRRLLPVIEESKPSIVISTYPLVTAALGYLRRTGKLEVPVVAVIPDYGVHALWVSPYADMHLVTSEQSARLVESAGGKAWVVRMPVDPSFDNLPPKSIARTKLGIPQAAFVALVAGGAWGIGDIRGAAEHAAAAGAFTIVVTGKNVGLKKHLEACLGNTPNIKILGWTDNMPDLMAASDCLIQNAGGVTCLEALHVGLPIIMYNPVPGHGEMNVRVMEQAGAVCCARTPQELTNLLTEVMSGQRSLHTPIPSSLTPSVVDAVESTIARPARATVGVSNATDWLRRVGYGIIAASVFLWLSLTPTGLVLASRALKLPVVGYHAPKGRVSIGVRVSDPLTARAIEQAAWNTDGCITIFADDKAAIGLYPSRKVQFGVSEPSYQGRLHSPFSERRHAALIAHEIQDHTGEYPHYFLPAGSPNITELIEMPKHTHLATWHKTGRHFPDKGLIIVDARGLSPSEAVHHLHSTMDAIRLRGLTCTAINGL